MNRIKMLVNELADMRSAGLPKLNTDRRAIVFLFGDHR
jgi:hypothetical protein